MRGMSPRTQNMAYLQVNKIEETVSMQFLFKYLKRLAEHLMTTDIYFLYLESILENRTKHYNKIFPNTIPTVPMLKVLKKMNK